MTTVTVLAAGGIGAVILAGCAHGHPAGQAAPRGAPATSASVAVQEYIRAASDSNLTRMAELFGTDQGNAERLHVQGLDKRMVITQAFLAKTVVRTLGEVKGAHANERLVTTEIALGACKVVIPVTAVESKQDGWLVRDLDLAKVEDLKRPCQSKSGNPGR